MSLHDFLHEFLKQQNASRKCHELGAVDEKG